MNTKKILGLFERDLAVVNLGLTAFAQNLIRTGGTTVQVDYRPPCGGDPRLMAAFDVLTGEDGRPRSSIDLANREAVSRLMSAKPQLVGIGVAERDIPGMQRDLILHSGPPITWDRMSGPTRGAVIGGLLYERLAKTPEEAKELAASGQIAFEPCHHHRTVGPMAGVVTASMPVWVVENSTYGNRAYSTLNEGLGRVLRYGAYDASVIERLRWMEEVLAPALRQSLDRSGPIDIGSLIAQALQMGDEVHNRNRAATSLLIRLLAKHLVRTQFPSTDLEEVFRFLDGNDHYFLNLSMASCKSSLDPASAIRHSTLVTAMARNGTEFGIRVSGLGDRWFTAPSPMVDGLYLPGFSRDDAAPDIGDSTITETGGLGGFAMAAAPAIVQFVGGRTSDALAYTQRVYEITMAEHPTYKIPPLDFRGTPTGIDLLKIVDSSILPVVNTGIAHKTPGIGMVGAGLVKPPMTCFAQALLAFAQTFQGDV